ncbi:hypothetical protein ACQ33O_08510 [Ferruginibacter sp. SUN002]|uniref:hypothetical protein n=1 Tax=Ferruginibacter sp. SUN002 TaxID=2937789 RepID=UPI003D36D0E8
MVEVFKTNVNRVDQSEILIKQLLSHFPGSKINFDLEDCDKILRIEAEHIAQHSIIAVLNEHGFNAEVLI